MSNKQIEPDVLNQQLSGTMLCPSSTPNGGKPLVSHDQNSWTVGNHNSQYGCLSISSASHPILITPTTGKEGPVVCLFVHPRHNRCGKLAKNIRQRAKKSSDDPRANLLPVDDVPECIDLGGRNLSHVMKLCGNVVKNKHDP